MKNEVHPQAVSHKIELKKYEVHLQADKKKTRKLKIILIIY